MSQACDKMTKAYEACSGITTAKRPALGSFMAESVTIVAWCVIADRMICSIRACQRATAAHELIVWWPALALSGPAALSRGLLL